jgi:glyoxylase-like metal-dependent hydrolase (beta-lactamase superfamily II)
VKIHVPQTSVLRSSLEFENHLDRARPRGRDCETPVKIRDLEQGVSALGPQTELIFGKDEASFLARAGMANHFSGKSKFSSIDFSAVPAMAPLGPSVDVFGDGSFWAISVPGHTDDDIAYMINGANPVLLTGDASHFKWAFQAGMAQHGWNKAGTERGYQSLEQLRAFARAYPGVTLVFGHEADPSPNNTVD